MYKALLEAERSLESGDVPVGAVVVHDEKIIGRGCNKVEKLGSSLAHAEITAINQAVKKLGHKHLLDCKLYVTLEPCSMCAGAIVLARIPELFIGTDDPKTGACGSIFDIVREKKLNHRCKVNRGVLSEECSKLLKDFFSELRDKKKKNGREK